MNIYDICLQVGVVSVTIFLVGLLMAGLLGLVMGLYDRFRGKE